MVNLHSCGPLSSLCDFCHAKHFNAERNSTGNFTNCCHNGKVQLQELSPPPSIFKQLMTQTTPDAINFRDNIRQYNSALSFASMGATLTPPPGHGPYCFRIHGQIYHRTGPLHPSSNRSPSHNQLYILDTHMANLERMRHPENSHCTTRVMTQLQNTITSINPFAQAFRLMGEIEAEEQARATLNGENPHAVLMTITSTQDADRRRYNATLRNIYNITSYSPTSAKQRFHNIS